MKLTSIAIAAVALLMTASCGTREIDGEGPSKTEQRAVGDVTKIDISAQVKANITVQPGAKSSVQLSGYQNLLEYVETTMEGSTLHIRNKPGVDIDTDKDLVATIIVSSLQELEVSGGSDASVNGIVSGSSFDLDISGAGNVTIQQITVNELEVEVSGAGKASIAGGTAAKASYDVSGAGGIMAYGLQAKDVSADVSGAGDVELSALTTLDADVSGAGSITYRGTPALKSNTSGAGEITAAK